MIEAHEAKEKITGLKRELTNQKRQQLEDQQQGEIESLMESQVKEMNAFNEFWDQKIEEFEQEAYNIEAEMLDRHSEERISVEEELRRVVPMKKKMTTQHLNYKKALETLVKQKDYIEADRMKVLCDQLEKTEISKAYQEKEQRIKFFMSQLEHRHKNELNVLRKRIGTGREELLKGKVLELEKLLHRFQNGRHQLNLSHTLEHSKFEHANKSVLLEDPSMRTTTRSTSRKGSRNSKMSLRTRENSRGHLTPSMLSPTHNIDLSNFATTNVSPATATSTKHKRSYTSVGINKFDASGLSESNNSEIKSKRANSIVKQSPR